MEENKDVVYFASRNMSSLQYFTSFNPATYGRRGHFFMEQRRCVCLTKAELHERKRIPMVENSMKHQIRDRGIRKAKTQPLRCLARWASGVVRSNLEMGTLMIRMMLYYTEKNKPSDGL